YPSEVLPVFDHFFALSQRDVRLLPVRTITGILAAAALLTGNSHSPDFLDLDLEYALDGFVDLRLAGVVSHFETQGAILFLQRQPLLRDDGTFDDIENRAHFDSTSCNAWIAAFENTTWRAFRT